MNGLAGMDPELARFLREELGHELPAGGEWQFTGPVWVWKGNRPDGSPSPASWHFLTITGDVANAIRAAAPGRSAAWGSVYVKVRIGQTDWETSLFPSKQAEGWLLPIKAAVRKKERIAEGDMVTVALRV